MAQKKKAARKSPPAAKVKPRVKAAKKKAASRSAKPDPLSKLRLENAALRKERDQLAAELDLMTEQVNYWRRNPRQRA